MNLRKINTCYGVWEFLVGRENVLLYSSNGEKYVIDLSTLTGRSWNVIEEGRHDGNIDGMITPYRIRRYVENMCKSLSEAGKQAIGMSLQ